jgi:ribonuclease Z
MDRFGPATLIETRLLFDCGRGTMQRIYQIDQNASTFDKLFLTHLHSDHTTGIPDLWITGRLRGRYDTPLQVWGTRGTTNMIHHIREAWKTDLKVRREARVKCNQPWNLDGLKIVSNDIDEGYVYKKDGIKVIPFRVNHHEVYSEEPSLGYRVEYDGSSLVISGDTRYCENLIQYSRGVDVLIHEVAAAPLGASIPDNYALALAHHTLPEECGKIFSVINPKLAVYYHVIQFEGVSLEEMMERTRMEYSGPVVFGEDLMQIEIGEKVKIINQ